MSDAVAVPTPSSALDEFRAAMGGEAGAVPGLESVAASDLALPIIDIDHPNGKFRDKLTGQTWDTLDVVLLGLLKQRVMWPEKQAAPGTTPHPLCKSREAEVGVPAEEFPWEIFKAQGSPEPVGAPTVSCETCYFAKWGSHPKNDTPWCTLQHVYPVIVGDGEDVTALLTIQRTGIKPSNGYLTGFVREGIPMFVTRTKIALDVNRNGTVQWAAPKFSRGEPTPQDVTLWQRWARKFTDLRAVVQGTSEVGRRDAVVTPAPAIEAAPAAPAATAADAPPATSTEAGDTAESPW